MNPTPPPSDNPLALRQVLHNSLSPKQALHIPSWDQMLQFVLVTVAILYGALLILGYALPSLSPDVSSTQPVFEWGSCGRHH